jgi:cytochrome bd ubiquinol oxidase subunit I
MSAELLARIQFAFTTSFHFIFPPLSIGLGLFLVLMEGSYLRTGNKLYHDMTRFWVLIFGLIFGIGVATGIVLEFEFGTNWSRYAVAAGDVFGSPLAAEGVFAFFLESGFLGILVFGWDKVSKTMHFVSTILVWMGSMFSAVWIIVANSWMQTPAGHKIVQTPLGPKAELIDFWAVVFNPSTVDRLTHTIVAAFITAACLVASVSAYYLLKKRHEDFARESMKLAVIVGLSASIAQVFIGHQSAVNVAKNQPEKYAAMEGYYDSSKPNDLVIAGYVDEAKKEVVGLKIPGGGNALLGDVKPKGINDFDPESEPMPPVQPVFQSFRIMVGLGFFFIAMFAVAAILLPGGRLFKADWLLKIMVPAVVLPHIANNLGWMTAELGRQPWTIYKVQTTSEGVSPNVTAPMVLGSLILFVLLYALLGVLFLYLLDRRIKRGPTFSESPEKDEALLKPDMVSGPAQGGAK